MVVQFIEIKLIGGGGEAGICCGENSKDMFRLDKLKRSVGH